MKTTSQEKDLLDLQVARLVYATNMAFRSVEHPQFIQLMKQLRPGYNPPSRREIGGTLLDTIYMEEKRKCSEMLQNKIVCAGIDGWSNVHNEPIVCVTVTTATGDTYLVDTVDTSGNSHTSEYLAEIACNSIKKCEEELKCYVRSVVTDNANNVAKMRQLLENHDDLNVITYGCSAHVLNLLAKDCQFPNIKEHVLVIVKYFRNNHFANALYRQSDTPNLIMPANTRWNSLVDCLQAYIKGWSVLFKICEDHRDKIDDNVQSKVANVMLKRNVEDMIAILKPISVTLDKVQRNECPIAHAVYLWKQLKKEFWDATQDETIRQKFINRYNMALTPTHFLAYIIDPKQIINTEPHLQLTENEKKIGLDFACSKYASAYLLPLIIKFQAKASPFMESFFHESVVTEVSAHEWWKSQKEAIDAVNTDVFSIIEQLLTAQASSASVERIFSSFGLVHSKLRNKLGTEKASRLAFLFKMFNSSANP